VIEAHGPDLGCVLEEAAFGLAELAADVDPLALLERDADALPRLRPVQLEAPDPASLAGAWLTELLSRIEVDGALVAIEVEAVAGGPAPGAQVPRSVSVDEPSRDPGRWTLRARVATLAFDGAHVRRGAALASVTEPGAQLSEGPDGRWSLSVRLGGRAPTRMGS
jgi:hypothetical protein